MSSLTSLIRRKVPILAPTDTVFHAARAMRQNNTASVIIAESSGQIVGIITDRDITCRVVAETKELDPLMTLDEVMTPDIVFVDESAPLETVVDFMILSAIRNVPIVKSVKGQVMKCVGIITFDDLLAAKKISTAQAAHIVDSQTTGVTSNYKQRKKIVRRAEARKIQTQGRFNNVIADQIQQPKSKSIKLTRLFLENIVRRLHSNEAFDFISQLPTKWQEELLDLPAGPDRHIKAAQLVKDVAALLGIGEDESKKIVSKLSHAISELISPKEFDHVCAVLPKDFQILILGHELDNQLRSQIKKGYPEEWRGGAV